MVDTLEAAAFFGHVLGLHDQAVKAMMNANEL
jgi:hypothetical protein